MERAKLEPLHAAQGALRFADFTLDLGRGALLHPDGVQVALRPKTAKLLRHLAERAGHVVTREALLEAVWPGVYVSEDSVTQCVAEIRRALGERAEGLLRTLPKRGYLLDAEPPQKAAVSDDSLPAQERGAATPALNRPSLVVLPFTNLSDDPEQEYFTDGITEELTTALSRVRWFFVIARNSAFTYKGEAIDVRQVGRDLGVRYALSGSVRRSGQQIRVAVQLSETEAGRHVWGERIDGTTDDVFGLQDRVAEAVAGAIEPRLHAAEFRRSRTRPTDSLDAYDLYLRALPHHYLMTAEGSERALILLRDAARLDPEFAVVKALAGFCQAVRALQGWIGPGDVEEGIRFAREAITAGSDDPTALQYAARALGLLAFDREAALTAVEQSLALNPNSAQAHQTAGYVNNWLCRPAAALAHFERATRLSPVDPEMVHVLTGTAVAHLVAGEHELALNAAQRALRIEPSWADAHRQVVTALWLLGRQEEAKAAVIQSLEKAPEASRVFAERSRKLFSDQGFVAARSQALRQAGMPE